MSLKQGLIRARSHLIFLLGLLSAFALVFWLENIDLQRDIPELPAESALISSTARQSPQLRMLSEQERQWATIAWQYFKKNTVRETGLANSADNYNSTTLWDTSSYLMAIIAARRLDLIGDIEFDSRIIRALKALSDITLFDGQLPNKVYNTRTLAMVDYNNQPSAQGIGWSAIDIGRIMVPFNILVWNYPKHTFAVNKVVSRWKLPNLLRDGSLYGAALTDNNEINYLQEGRLGYEEYAAKAFNLMGKDVSVALDYTNYLKMVDIYGVAIAIDSRDPALFDAHNYVVSEPYILDGLEYGWDRISRELAWRVYQVQEKRFAETGVLTAVSEGNIDQAPYFVYNTVFTDGKAWNTITEAGQDATAYRTLSTKAAFGWHVLYETAYTQQLVDKVNIAHDPERGWYSGIYEADGTINKVLTANTNGIVLEALAFKQTGAMLNVGLP